MNTKLFKFSALAVVLLACGSKASAQASATATATATATIITPITIAKTSDMNFGNVAVHATNPGTVLISAAGVRTAGGGVTLPTTQGTVSSAAFTVNGQTGYTYAITLPASVTITDGASHSMNVDQFSCTPGATGLLTGGTENITVGATLNVAAAQTAGVYSSATPFNVTVNYN
jgi:hypothetical protein